jgi:hypothetical protein
MRGPRGCHPLECGIFIFDDGLEWVWNKRCGTLCYNSFAMTIATTETILVPAGTVVVAKGDGPTIDVSGAPNRVFLVTLAITKIIEQESLDVSIFGSSDGAAWGAKSIAAFPQKFYCEESPLLLDLTAHPDVKFVRAHWEVARWGRGTETPMFEFGVTMKEVPANILQEATVEARTRA